MYPHSKMHRFLSVRLKPSNFQFVGVLRTNLIYIYQSYWELHSLHIVISLPTHWTAPFCFHPLENAIRVERVPAVQYVDFLVQRHIHQTDRAIEQVLVQSGLLSIVLPHWVYQIAASVAFLAALCAAEYQPHYLALTLTIRTSHLLDVYILVKNLALGHLQLAFLESHLRTPFFQPLFVFSSRLILRYLDLLRKLAQSEAILTLEGMLLLFSFGEGVDHRTHVFNEVLSAMQLMAILAWQLALVMFTQKRVAALRTKGCIIEVGLATWWLEADVS